MPSSVPPHSQPAVPRGTRRGISHAIFDFDGTLSWLRSGWPDVMTQLFIELLPANAANSPEICRRLRNEILALNGKPSIHQMERFHELAPQFKAIVPSPADLLHRYLARLDSALHRRVDAIIRKETPAEHFVIAGAFALLDELRARGITLVILSGTAETDVRRESELLRLQPYFNEHIYGSTPGVEFSKKQVIDRIVREEGIEGAHLLSFGDGPVEIQFTKAVGGLAIGVASDEHENGSGLMDPDKREHLVRAGADVIIPDYRNASWILETFFP
jgi:phosphoglycolate phosphatase-like HAD superfamily hydrolase